MGTATYNIQTIIITVLTTLLASSGFWTYLSRRKEKTSATTKLLMGLAHDKLLTNGMRAIKKGYIDTEQYTDIRRYLYEPYIELGGNGIVERIMEEVSKLPLVNPQDVLEKDKKQS